MYFISYVLLRVLKIKIIEVFFFWEFFLVFYFRKEVILINKGEMWIYDNLVEENL